MNILLLEPNYKNKYPPLGLMKLAYYHKEHRGDYVLFQKGITPTDQTTPWDRIYITTLFTYEWDRTIETIEYAKTLLPKEKIFIGGIMATLMSDEIFEATGIRTTKGLLTNSAQIGFSDNICIDTLIPDYSILDDIEYIYPDYNAYFASATKGCGMKCSFCAVQTLEPEYNPYISIKEQIKTIDEKYGKRRNLLLMDNNVLKSAYFEQIIEDIIEAGFGKGATWTNPKTGKENIRYVDFNQGLDANFLTDEKAALLSKLSIKPVRIAFDHIEETPKYLKAVQIAERHGLNNISNYMLYNTPEFKGKGNPRSADTPLDLYNRLKTNINFAEETKTVWKSKGKGAFHLYSYPMQFLPLGAKNRDYMGENWTTKTYQAVKRIIHISKGVVYDGRSFFHMVWGRNIEEFSERILLPKLYIEECLAVQASLSSENTRNNVSIEGYAWLMAWQQWRRIYSALSDENKEMFTELISSNVYSADSFCSIKDTQLRKLYLHYISPIKFADFLKEIEETNFTFFEETVQFLGGAGKWILYVNSRHLRKLKRGSLYLTELESMLNCDESCAFSFYSKAA